GLDLAGLCDIGEEKFFQRALTDAGLGHDLSRAAMEELGFAVCDVDLEDELIRTLGVDAVERVLNAQGDLRAFRTFQNQPAQRTRPVDAQLRRFLGSIGGRKSRYARALVEALGVTPAPRPLEVLLDAAAP
ncbi:MAG: ATP-dependent endonuclease, partial [Mycetocola sp.]